MSPGDLLKVPTLVIPFVAAETLFWLLKKRPRVASTASGALASLLIAFFIINVLDGDASPFLYLIGAVEGGAGGFVGYGIYTKIGIGRQSSGSDGMDGNAPTRREIEDADRPRGDPLLAESESIAS